MLYIGIVFLMYVGLAECSGEYCIIGNSLEYCNYGCCSGSCCGLTTMAIVGFVIGGVLALTALIGCIICLACMCKQASRKTTPIQPMHNNNMVYVNSNPYHPPPRNPPSYNQYGSYPASSFADPAYPPGSAHPPPSYSSLTQHK